MCVCVCVCECECIPYSQVVSQQLHDEGTVLVGLLLQVVQVSNGIVKCLNGKFK